MPVQSSLYTLADGRVVDILLGSSDSGPALVLHHGTPLDASVWQDWDDLARQAGLRLVSLTRPGYAASGRLPGRDVAACAYDVAEILASLSAPWFVTAGWSGGGPHALACAALLPTCRAAATLAGVAPASEPDLDFTAGMAAENVTEYNAALSGEPALRDWMKRNASLMRTISGTGLADAFGGLLPQVDRDVVVGPFAQSMAAQIRRALAQTVDGWIDDDLAFARPWGFDVRDIRVPVTVWQGDLDLMVPAAHGRWLADHIPGATPKFKSGHGHISLVTTHRWEIIANLVAQGQSLSSVAVS